MSKASVERSPYEKEEKEIGMGGIIRRRIKEHGVARGRKRRKY